MTKYLLEMVLKQGTSLGSGLFLCMEKNFERFKVDVLELVTMTTDGIPAAVSVNIRLVKHKHNVTFCQDTEF